MLHRIILAIVVFLAPGVLAQSTAFTNQGELASNGGPGDGAHDMRFRLFDASTGGAQVGSTQCVDNVPVASGKFTTTIDFGQVFANTSARYLEIEVRADSGLDCSNTNGYTLLTPRQAITPAPRAASANTAFSLSAPDGSPANALVVDNDGRVGVGTSTPGHSLTIANAGPTIALQDTDSNGSAGGTQVGYVSYRDAGNVERAWVGFGTAGDPDFSIITARPDCDIVLNNLNGGNVGIGTAVPTAKLEVRGEVRYGTLGQYRPIAGEEPLRMVRGTVSATGTLIVGLGYSIAHPQTGVYTITFTTPFTGAPTVTTAGDFVGAQSVSWDVNVDTVTASSFTVRTISASNLLTDAPFHFIAVGPR